MTLGALQLRDSTGRLSNTLAIGDFLFPATPAALKPLLGACTSNNTTWAILQSAVGQFQARRTFEGGGSALPATYAASRAASDPAAGLTTYMSFKPNQDGGVPTFATSTIQQNWFRGYCTSVPLDQPTNITPWHEPGNDLAAFTLAQYKAMVVKAGQIVQEVRAARGPRCLIRLGTIFEGPWDYDSANTTYGQMPYGPCDWSFTPTELQYIDWIGCDPYLAQASQPSLERLMTYDDSGRLNTQARGTMQKLASMGKPIVFGEWGVTSNNQTDQAKADKITAAWAWMKAWNAAHPQTPVDAALYFHYNLEADVTWEVLGAGEELAKAALIEILTDAKS